MGTKEEFGQKQCKICNAKNKREIERDILSMKSLKKVADKHKDFNQQNLSVHYRKHMSPVINTTKNKLLKKEAEKRVDGVKELEEMFEKYNEIESKVELDPNDESFVAKLNALRQLMAMKIKMIVAYTKLTGDDADTRNTQDLVSTFDLLKKQMKKRGQEIVVFEKVNKNETTL